MADVERAEKPKEVTVKVNSIQLSLKTVVHIIYLVINVSVSSYGAYIKFSLTEEQLKDSILSNIDYALAFLTNWNYTFQTIFLFLALSHDALEWMSKQDNPITIKIRYWRDVVFSGLVVPYTCFVFSMFWSLYAIDRELVFPKVYDAVVPWWFNQCVHSNILLLLVVETMLQPRRWPKDRKVELAFNAAVGILYAIVYYSIYFIAGRWLYNVFGRLTWWQVCLYQLLIWSFSYVFYELQFPINRIVHGKEPENQKHDESKPQNGDIKSEEVKEISEVNQNGGTQKIPEKNGEIKMNSVDFQIPPFSTKSWSLKYRSIREQFENSRL